MADAKEAGTGAGIIGTRENPHQLERHDATHVNIYGQSYLEKRQEITITVRYPNEHTEIRRVQSTDDGKFRDVLRLDKDSQPGTYYIEGRAENGIVGRVDFQVNPLRDPPVAERQIPQFVPPSLIINTDNQSYSKGDTIIINGAVTGSNLYSAGLKIFSPSKQIHAEQIIVNRDGTFSTSINTAGSAWSQSGKYTIDVSYADRVEKITISFVSTPQNTPQQQIQKRDMGETLSDDLFIYVYIAVIVIAVIVAGIIGYGVYRAIGRRSSKFSRGESIDWAPPTNGSTDFIFDGNPESATRSAYSNTAHTPSEPAKKDPVMPRATPKNTSKQKTKSKIINETPIGTPMFTDKTQIDIQKPDILKQESSTGRQVLPQLDYDLLSDPAIVVIDTNILIFYAEAKIEAKIKAKIKAKKIMPYNEKIIMHMKKYMNDNVLYVPFTVLDEFTVRSKEMTGAERIKISSAINDVNEYIGNIDDDSQLHNNKNFNKISGSPTSEEWEDTLKNYTEIVFKFYEGIYNSEDQAKKKLIKKWAMIKGQSKEMLIDRKKNSANDKKILATAIQLRDINPGRKVILFSRDSDFNIFKQLIKDEFKIKILKVSKPN